MDLHKFFNLVIAICLALSLTGLPGEVLAQNPPPNLEITIDEFPVPGGGPVGITAGPDGNLWFGEWCGYMIGRITTDGSVTSFPTSGACTLFGTAGADGNMWFTVPLYGDPPGGYIARITPTGEITEFPVPTQNQFSPSGITSGPGGNIWYTDPYGNLIGKFTPATGAFTEYPTPTGKLNDLTFGPDGNIWFTDEGGNQIGKMTPDGTVVNMYPIPTGGSSPFRITTGPDGNLWFSEYSGASVGRVTTNGDITLFPIPSLPSPSGYGTSDITTGPDGNLWFTESGNSKIGRITLAGEITEYPIPTENSGPAQITLGSDGNLWFTESWAGKIGRITIHTNNTNNPPVITEGDSVPVTMSVNGSPTPFNLTLHATDADADTLTWSISSPASHGTASASGTGDAKAIGYAPDMDYAGDDSFAVQVDDGNGGTDVIIVNVTLRAVQPGPEITIVEFPLPGVSPAGLAAGPDGNLWFGEWCGYAIGRITTDGTVTTFPTTGTCSLFTTAGADGNIWFTQPLYGPPPGGYLTRITPTGQLTEIPIPTQNQFDPLFIISGPDGNIWFTEQTGGQIVKYTLATGSFTEYPVGGSPNGITFGPDGNIWFIDYGGLIGKMTPDGTVTKYSTPNGALGPSAIITGPDGNLWFSERYGSVGRITTNGDITQFPIPSGNGVSSITAGPDGNLWFTELWNNKIGQITPTGQITEYPIPTENSVPGWITLGPDGNLWFTESSGIKIGRITINTNDTNNPPAISAITVPVAPVALGQSIEATVTFSDPDVGDSHTVTWDWGDNISATPNASVPSVTSSHTYSAAGIYTIMATIVDAAGASASATSQFVVIYDPNGGFVTGGGWFNSPSGAYLADPTLTGKANFGFVAKYKKGTSIPDGNTEFQFKAGSLNFKSTSYQWLVVNQNYTNAQFKGYGTINGVGNYGFMLWATDGSPDTFRIKIWVAETDSLVYDNGVAQPIGGGSIVVHK
jgi:streptogramin lyase